MGTIIELSRIYSSQIVKQVYDTVAPPETTTVWTYTVQADEKILLNRFHLYSTRLAAATTPDRWGCYIHVTKAGNALTLMNIESTSNTVLDYIEAFESVDILLDPNDTIVFTAKDDSTGGQTRHILELYYHVLK